MYKILRVGDFHCQVSNLKDSEKLIDFIIKTAKENDIKTVEFLGDLFHTHAIKRIEVEHFWMEAFDKLDECDIRCIALVGNHDQCGSKEKEQLINSLNLFQPRYGSLSEREIVSHPKRWGGVAYIPYHSNHDDFLKAAHELYDQGATELLIAHQTFTGAQYENGFFSEEGIDPDLVPQKQIISGHIHKSQQVGKCFYPGTPKWDTMSDVNQEKGIWIFTHDKSGQYIDKEFISTSEIVTPIISYDIKEGDVIPKHIDLRARNYVTLEGKTAWINKIKLQFKGCNIKIKNTDRTVKNISTNLSINEYLQTQFQPIAGVDKEELKQFITKI
jgi:DNA repair exonuclease SbcCD nuclease subunit